MSTILQAHYLKIEWRESGSAREITVAPEPIEIEESDDGTLVAETQVFHDLCPWVGLRLEGELAGVQPAFERADGSLTPMLQLDDGKGGHWWVQNDGWDAVGKRHLSELHRSMGQFTVVMGTRRLLVKNVVDQLSRVEVEDYLRDFQQDLIWLVMGFGGATAATGSGLIVNREMVEALEAFSIASRQVLTHPARHVREIQLDSRPARLRPNMATFRQYLRNPDAQRLPGRGAEETPDIADNRYLRHMVQVCEKLASSLSKSVEHHAKRFSDRARIEAERSTAYRGMTHRQVDPDVFDNQLEELRNKLERVEEYRDFIPNPGETLRRLEFKAGIPYGKRRDKIFFLNKDGSKSIGKIDEEDYGYSVLRIAEPLLQSIQAAQSFCDYYQMRGLGYQKLEQTHGGSSYREVHFTDIYSVKPFTGAIERKTAKRAQLENNNWLARLSDKERQDNREEAHTAHLRGQTYRMYGQQAEQAFSALSKCQADLRSQDLDWKRIGVVSSAVVPMGVRFSQSPDYTTCQAAFSKINEIAKINGGLGVDAFDAIEKIGVLHASALYERWCLVKMISILMEDYRFQPDAGWQERLVRAITGIPQSLELKFRREELGMSAYLEVQPEFPNGRRPDFRLRFRYDSLKPLSDREEGGTRGFQSAKDQLRGEMVGGLVMDSKFRTHWYRDDLGRMLNSLVNEKEYGQQGDRVFILHPAQRSMLKPSSPLTWGKDCNYGQEVGNNHMQGSVYLAPRGSESNSDNNLQRLIAMQLQATFPDPVEVKSDGYVFWEVKCFCIRCGKAHQPEDVEQRFTKRGGTYWTLSCNACGMHTTRTHCYGCNSRIHKNGLNLTYHKTVADQVTNIFCPQCGKYFDSEVHGGGRGLNAQDNDI